MVAAMRKLFVLGTLLVAAACGGDDEHLPGTPDASPNPPPAGPFDELDLGEDLIVGGLDGAVHVARDRYGVAHIHATTRADLAFAQGYVMAHDRLPQMDILRRFGSGTLAELFGALDDGIIETDLEMRVHRMRPLATEAWTQLQASSDPTDQEIVEILQRFSDGVNAYAEALAADRWSLDPAVLASFDPARFEAWSPIDSLVLGRFQAFALSWTTPIEVDITEIYQGLHETFDQATGADPAAFARRGISDDILRLTPVGRRPTIDGFPNVDVDTGTRSDAGRPAQAPAPARRAAPKVAAKAKPGKVAKAAPTRPHVPRELLRSARDFFRATMVNGPHAFMAPRAGSNNWVVSDELAGGKTLIAGDQHLDLPNPSIFYPVHLILDAAGADDDLSVQGITFPGIPGIVLGHNGEVAWSATVVFHDVNDVYLETIQPCASGGGDCAQRADGEVRIEPWTEEITVGALGTPTDTIEATYELVPGRGPIIPNVVDGELVPRTGGAALSVQYTGYDTSFEIRATYGLMKAGSVDDAFAALANFSYGGQNWVIIDNQGNIGWTSNARVPLRSPAAYTWNGATNPDGLAPFFVLPGDGSVEWEGFMSSRYVPHAINPPEGYLATANSDPVGASFDGDPFNAPIVDGRPLWVGSTYAAGVRTERIRDLLDEAIAGDAPLTLDDLARIQHDSASTMGAKLRDGITAALAYAADPTGAPADVATYVAGLSSGDRARLADARARLAAWTFETPPAVAGSPTAGEVADSVATTIFNHWVHFFIERTLGDELDAIAFDVWDVNENLLARTLYGIVVEPGTMTASATTTQPIVCDDMTVGGADQSCTQQILAATLAALDHLETSIGADPDTWVWGDLHRLTLKPLFPNTALEVPAPDEGGVNAGGFPRAGDNFVVNRADCGWRDLDFSQSADGPAQRFLVEAEVGGTTRLRWALPGGAIYDRSSSHYRDLLDDYYLQNDHFDAPYAIDEIVDDGEQRWVIR